MLKLIKVYKENVNMREINRLYSRVKESISGLGSEETRETLMLSGRVEKLVQEGRPPLRLGSMGALDEEMLPYYQVPPQDFDPKKIKEVFMGSGCYVFVYKNGKQKIGSTFTVTDEEAEEIEYRIKAER